MVGVPLGIDDAFYRVIGGDLCGFEQILVVHQRTGEGGGINVPGSVTSDTSRIWNGWGNAAN